MHNYLISNNDCPISVRMLFLDRNSAIITQTAVINYVDKRNGMRVKKTCKLKNV